MLITVSWPGTTIFLCLRFEILGACSWTICLRQVQVLVVQDRTSVRPRDAFRLFDFLSFSLCFRPSCFAELHHLCNSAVYRQHPGHYNLTSICNITVLLYATMIIQYNNIVYLSVGKRRCRCTCVSLSHVGGHTAPRTAPPAGAGPQALKEPQQHCVFLTSQVFVGCFGSLGVRRHRSARFASWSG